MRRLARAIDGLEEPAVEKIAKEQQEDPFQVLIATMLSAQTKDAVTAAASGRLFRVARTPKTLAKLPVRKIEELIYPVSFYRNKAVHVRQTCEQILARYGGRVPSTMEELLTLPGVGRKTANLVLILAHASRDNICVDTHVHRIANRLGWVTTRTPEETEHALYRATHAAVVGDHQPVSGDLGTERLPSGVSALCPSACSPTSARGSGSRRSASGSSDHLIIGTSPSRLLPHCLTPPVA